MSRLRARRVGTRYQNVTPPGAAPGDALPECHASGRATATGAGERSAVLARRKVAASRVCSRLGAGLIARAGGRLKSPWIIMNGVARSDWLIQRVDLTQ
eukprot:2979010-Pyramimonas_sp.AAC.2